MNLAPAQALPVPLTADEQDTVRRAAAVAGSSVDEFMRAAVLAASETRFLMALERATTTIAARDTTDVTQHDYAPE
ncbi:hypothetical protein ACFQ6U_13945 [Streptomyces sp. NPDC056465]|uniref:hypothetical protein n=1 Tax=unclassified Streptomyces TaxID=2593676 RepID=UPI0035D8BABB